VLGDLGDVVQHRVAQGGTAETADPAGLLVVPRQGVAAQLLAVAGREVGDRVTLTEGERVLLRLRRVPLHLVFRRDLVVLTAGETGVVAVAEVGGAQRGAEVPAVLGRRGTECAGGVGYSTPQNGARDGQCGNCAGE